MNERGFEAMLRTSGAYGSGTWIDALATARPGWRYRLTRIASSVARRRCREVGCVEGQVVICTGNGGGVVRLQDPGGREIALERELAWFVRAEVSLPMEPAT